MAKKKKQEEQLNIFSPADKIDAVIKSRLANFSIKGGNLPSNVANPWTEEELELRDGVIWDYMVNDGLGKEATARQIAARWGIGMNCARKYVKIAIQNLAKDATEETVEERRKMFLERCESIYQAARESGNLKAAANAIDLMGKASGIYREEKDINLSGEANIKFEFGE